MNEALHVVCPHCDAVNRLPSASLERHPKCGKCHQPLFDGSSAGLSAARLRKHLDRSELPLLVEFWAPWCGHCRNMAPAFERAAALLQPRVRLAKVNGDQEPALTAGYAIQGFPTLILFRDGKEVARQAGALTAEQIVAWTRAHF